MPMQCHMSAEAGDRLFLVSKAALACITYVEAPDSLCGSNRQYTR